MLRLTVRVSIAALCAVIAASSMNAAHDLVPLHQPSILLARPLPNPEGRTDIAASVFPLKDGALISGWTSAADAAPDALLVRVNRDGDVVWRREIGGDALDILWTILPDPAGGYVCTGFTGSRGAGSLDGWLVHFDGEGKIDWERTYGGTGEDRLTGLQATPDGWMAVGQTKSFGATGIDAWVVRVDGTGQQLSSWTTGQDELDRAFGIHPMPDGGCIITGMTGGESNESDDLFITRLSSGGKAVWSHRPRKPGFQVGHDIHPFTDGTLLVVGYGFVSDAKHIDASVLRITPDGKLAWERSFGGKTYDRANHVEVFDDQSFAVVGYSQRPGARNEDEAWDLMVYHADPAGRLLSATRYGGDGYEYGRGIAGTRSELWVVGHTSTGRSGASVLLIRMDMTSHDGKR